MDKIINKYQAICGVVWIVICCILILRPTRFVTEKPVVVSNQEISARSEAIKDDNLAAQRFVAPYSHLADIKIYLLNENPGGEFRFILFDADYNPIMDKNVIVEDTKELPGLYAIELNQDVEAGREYCYMIQGISEEFYVAYEDTAASGTTYNGQLFYCGAEVRGSNIITEYDYELPFGKGKAFAFYAAIILLGLLISFLAKKHYEKYSEKNCLLTVEMVWKRVLTPIVIVCAVVCLVAIWPLNMFSAGTDNDVLFNALDVVFYYAGILITAGILLYGINHIRRHKSNDMGLSRLRENWTDYLQAIFFALTVQASVHYMNALYENHHTIAYLEMLVYFGLSIIVTYKRKEIFNRINFIYIIIAAIGGYLYYNAQMANVETEDEMKILQLITYAIVIVGIVIINTVLILLRRQVRGLSWYGIIVALAFALLIIFRNTRDWPIYLACVFSVYYLRMAAWDKRERLLQNICNGILLHFLVMLGYCLLHRPYLFYNQTRYSFVFHTVTISAEYLSLVIGAAFVKLVQAYHKEKRFSNIWKELTIFGVSLVYLMLTLSRTGYLAIILTMITVFPLVCVCRRYKARTFLPLAAMLIASFIISFPAVFTMQRVVPAVVAKPEMFEIEWIPDEIKEKRDTDSRYYITIRRFAQIFENKVLGIPEDKCIVPYEPKAEDSYAMLIVSTETSGAMISDGENEIPENDNIGEYSSGRLDLFKLYISNLNMTGHDEMDLMSEDGSVGNVHAHNTYIQAAYDHGIPTGIIFILFIIYTLIRAVIYYNRRKEDRICSLLPFTLTIAFAGAGLTEWIFHPCNPLAFGMLLALAPLICDARGKSYNMVDKV
ncbi:MAG: hypothetical protein NC433_10010 [Clostridiales bacterium]|nr:hypothetical protein [Clostridiales bacterium]